MQVSVNPCDSSFIKYDCSQAELQARLMFGVVTANKTAYVQMDKFNEFLKSLEGATPFSALNALSDEEITAKLAAVKLGCYKATTKAFRELASANLDLRTCTLEELEKIHKISFKTSRFFVMFTRKGVEHAILDTHILREMRDKLGIPTPKITPQNPRVYKALEAQYLPLARDKAKQLGYASIVEYDFAIWYERSKKPGGKK